MLGICILSPWSPGRSRPKCIASHHWQVVGSPVARGWRPQRTGWHTSVFWMAGTGPPASLTVPQPIPCVSAFSCYSGFVASKMLPFILWATLSSRLLNPRRGLWEPLLYITVGQSKGLNPYSLGSNFDSRGTVSEFLLILFLVMLHSWRRHAHVDHWLAWKGLRNRGK